MKFARVIGTVVATRKYEGLEGIKFLVVQLLDEDLNPHGRPTIAADATAQAGPGELVFVVGSREAAQALVQIESQHRPDSERNRLYEKVYTVFLELEDRVAPLYDRLPVGGRQADQS